MPTLLDEKLQAVRKQVHFTMLITKHCSICKDDVLHEQGIVENGAVFECLRCRTMTLEKGGTDEPVC